MANMKGRGFEAIPRVIIDSGAAGVVGGNTFLVWQTIIGSVWRKEMGSYLLATISQSRLAALCGFGQRQGVHRHIERLEAIKWIQRGRNSHEGTEYAVGYLDEGTGQETLYATIWANEVWQSIEDLAQSQGLPTGWRVPPAERILIAQKKLDAQLVAKNTDNLIILHK